ncbi:MAG: hypothetical protein V8T45_04880 [Oscillospiraceae bacterium]
MTVKTAAGVDWQCIGSKGSTVNGIDNGDGTVTFNIENIDQPYIISPALEEDEFQVLYDIKLPHDPSDPEKYESATIGGGNTHTVIEQGTEHTVLAPSITEYFTFRQISGNCQVPGLGRNGDGGYRASARPNTHNFPGHGYPHPCRSVGNGAGR